MAWLYEISTGLLRRSTGVIEGKGYSGFGEFKDDPTKVEVRAMGPLPPGLWRFEEPFFHPKTGPYTLRLFPLKVPNLYGRAGFLIHGDSIRQPGTASHGCIVLSRALRMMLWESGDHEINVVGAVMTNQKENIA